MHLHVVVQIVFALLFVAKRYLRFVVHLAWACLQPSRNMVQARVPSEVLVDKLLKVLNSFLEPYPLALFDFITNV